MKILQKPNLNGLNDIIPVTPMFDPPRGLLFYLDFKYEEPVKKIINQIFSEIDPFGEEDWDS